SSPRITGRRVAWAPLSWKRSRVARSKTVLPRSISSTWPSERCRAPASHRSFSTPPASAPNTSPKQHAGWRRQSRRASMVVSHRFTVHDLELTPEDGKLYEIIDGELHVSAQPSTYHQLTSG